MLKWAHTFIIISLFACGCRKNSSPAYTVKTHPVFTFSKLTHFTGYRLFTARGEITDPAIVQKYSTEFSNFFYTTGSPFSDPAFERYAIVNDDSLWNLGIVPVGELGRKTKGDYDKFSSTQWLVQNDTNSLVLHLMKYKTYELAQSQGLYFLKAEAPYYIVKKIQDTLFFPVNKFVIISRTSYSTLFAADKFNNVLDTAGIHKMGMIDTMLTRQFDVALVKEK